MLVIPLLLFLFLILISKKDHEVMVVGKELGQDMVELVAAVVETYHSLLGVFCHSVSLALPPMKPQVGRCLRCFITFQG